MKAKITQKPDKSFHFSWNGKIRTFSTIKEGLGWLQKEKFEGEVDIKDGGETVKSFPSLEEAIAAN